MKRIIIILSLLLALAIPAWAYFGTGPFGTDSFEIGPFGAGSFSERSSTVAAAGGPSGDALLLETGDYILLETGDYLLLE